jgi:NADH-quinone oxidoreductase subunit A
MAVAGRRLKPLNTSRPMLENYLPVLVFIAVGLAVGVLAIAFGWLLAPNRPDSVKFDVRYYLVAILFIIFDLEIAFLFPWAVALNEIGMAGFIAMMVFLGVLVVGFIYEWKKGALEWE